MNSSSRRLRRPFDSRAISMNTKFKPGNPGGGRPKGSKNKGLPAEIKLRVLQSRAEDFERIMEDAANAKSAAARRWFADQYRRMLPKDEAVTVTNDKQLVIVVPKASDEMPVPPEIRDGRPGS